MYFYCYDIILNVKRLLNNIVGQERLNKLLDNQLQNGTTSHAYLFVGPKACGKLSCAKEFAKKLLGTQFENEIDKEAFPDLMICSPQGVHSYLSSQIKEIVASCSLAPTLAKYKIFIIQEADKLGTSGANAFLKTLEEPQAYVKFILIADNKENVLSTIISRCQVVEFTNIPYSHAVDVVQKETGAAPDDVETTLAIYGGNTHKAMDFLLDQNMQDLHSECLHVFENLNNISNGQLLQRSKDITNKINEIIDIYSRNLNSKTKEIEDVLEKAAVTQIEKQNKRAVAVKQKELLEFICNVFIWKLRNMLWKTSLTLKTELLEIKYIKAIKLLGEFKEKLAYNIQMQNFCDVTLLRLKEALT